MEPALTLSSGMPTAATAPLYLSTDDLRSTAVRLSWVHLDSQRHPSSGSEEAMDLSPRDRVSQATSINLLQAPGLDAGDVTAATMSAPQPIPTVPLTSHGDELIGATFLDQWDMHHNSVRRVLDIWENYRQPGHTPSERYISDHSSECGLSPDPRERDATHPTVTITTRVMHYISSHRTMLYNVSSVMIL